MPAVRWKFTLIIVIMAILVEIASIIAAQQMQDALSMSSDGWRPIVGTRRQPNQESSRIINEEHEGAETTISSLSSQKYATKNNNIKDRKTVKINKLHPKSPSGPSSSYYGPTGGSNQQLKKLQVAKKTGNGQNKSRKPIRGPMMVAHHSNRNEVFLPPPSNSGPGGSYSTFRQQQQQQQQNNVKIREAQGFGIISNNNFGINQFPVTSDGIQLQRPSSSSSYYSISKPLQNNDDFTRNFLPPARPRGTQQQQQQKSKGNTKISLYAFKDALDTDVASGLSQFGSNRPSIPHHHHHQYVPQIVPTYDFTINQHQQSGIKLKKLETTKNPSSSTGVQQADVQVTKENVKQYTHSVEPSAFGTIPPRNNYGFADYSSFAKTRPTISPNSHSTLTYEVTEGKWIDTPSQHYQFRPQDGFYQYQNIRQNQNNAAQIPSFFYQNGISTNRPAILQSPLVDISVPFLPTPYKPENVILPTSASENEASTVFTHVSNKMNRLQQYNNNNQRIPQENNNIFFNIKEVSTHYPILGTPEPATEIITETTPALNENNTENEIVTTHKEVIKERPRRPPATTHATTNIIRDPTRARITNKRRPIKIITTTSSTTTEEALTEAYEPVKSQEIEQDKIIETERPLLRRRRPRPPFRMPQEHQNEEQVSNEDESIRPKTRGNFRPHNTRIRTTTTENINEEINSVQRKRYRPSEYRGSVQNVQNEEQFEDNRSKQNYYNNEEAVKNYESTFVRQENRPYIEEIPATTEKIEDIQKVAFATEQFHNIPENEIDYTKTSLETEDEEEEEEITARPTTTTTTTTQQPSTTSTEAASTIRATRIRTRPNKDDLYTKRPRFSVKDKNRYTSTTTPSTTTTRSSDNNLRIRFPSRIRTRPSLTTAASSRIDENVPEEITTTLRTKFVPKEPRFGTTTTTTESNIITQNPIKAVNTRTRSFGKQQTETTTYTPNNYPKISIRPNLFSARRRDYAGLKSRINQFKKNDTEITTKSDRGDDDDAIEGVDPLNNNIVTTESSSGNISSDNAANESESEDISTEYTEQITENIMRDEDFFHSQRVSDLTSSFKDYDKPGVFNSISPTSRSIPNHFTISTDDPILPLEAFFPSLKETPKEIR